MEGFLRVDHATNLPGSPTNSFLADEVASTCPLITPSPPTNDLINSLPEPIEPCYAIGEKLAEKLNHVQGEDKCNDDSASSNSSALAEPACTQLLNHRNIYHHITKDEETAAQETTGKTQPLQLTFRNPPEDYFFMSWNWPLIRKVSMWMFLSGLVAMLALVIAMISTLPKTCNPSTEWYQGNLFYEIFPASFHRPNHKMEGNFKGIYLKADYIKHLGVRAIRLNSIFHSPNYPGDFENVTSLTDIDPKLGNLTDFNFLVNQLKSKNISLVLDLPLRPFVKKLTNEPNMKNETNSEPTAEFLRIRQEMDVVEDALRYWTRNGVDGFYLKGLEHFVEDINFPSSLRRWKNVIGPKRILIVNEKVINQTPKPIINIVLNNVDLVDVKLEIENGLKATKQIDSVLNGTLFSKPGMPWIHWSLGNVNSNRLANVLDYENATLGATLLQMMLPGTPSIFYGDEIGIKKILDPEGEKQDIKHLHQLTMMSWKNEKSNNVLPWIYGEDDSEVFFDQVDVISRMAALRSVSPAIYMNSVYKEGGIKANAEVKCSQDDFLVIQRWYPRRKPYVVACNLGYKQISKDLSTLLYSGNIVVGPKSDSKPGSISFKDISLYPKESVVIVLD